MPEQSHRTTRRSAIRGMLTAASVVAGLTFAGLATVGGSYALWQDQTTLTPGVIESGSLTLLANGQSSVALPSGSLQKMLPGDRVTRQVTLSNIGTVAADVTGKTTMSGTDYEVRVAKGTCPSTPLASASTLGAPVALGVWTAGEASAACIEVTLKPAASAAAQGTQAPLTVTFTASQKVS